MKPFNLKLIVLLTLSLGLTTRLIAEENIVYKPFQEKTENETYQKLEKLNYNEDKFNLAYQAYIYDGKAEEAYGIASIAIQHNPQSVEWLKRVAQTALWTNRPSIALNTYLKLVVEFKQTQYIETTATLAEQFHRDDILVTLYYKLVQQYPSNANYIIKLAFAYNGLGKTETAIELLQEKYKHYHNPQFIYNIAVITDFDKKTSLAKSAMDEYEKISGISAKTSLLQASYALSQHDIDSAYRKLNRISAKKNITDTKYWNDLAELAWLTNHPKTAQKAYLALLAQKRISEEGLRRLYLILDDEQSPIALSVAQYAWAKYQSTFAFFVLMNTALENQNWGLLNSLYQTPLLARNKPVILSHPAYWSGYANLMYHAGYKNEALVYLLRATLANNNDEFDLSYIHFLQMHYTDFNPYLDRYYDAALLAYQPKENSSQAWQSIYENVGSLMNDRVNAALDAGQIKLAQQLAFDGLQKTNNSTLHEQFELLTTKYSDTLSPTIEYEQFGNLQGARSIVTGDIHEERWTFTPLVSHWNPSSNNAGNIHSGCYRENIGSLNATFENASWKTQTILGYHEAFYASTNASIATSYKVSSLFTVNGKLAYNQRSTLDTYMLIAGSQDEALMNGQYQLTARDSFQTQLQYQQYYLQDRTQLGSGGLFNFGYHHQFLFAYPDVGITWNTDIDRFKRYNSYLEPSINKIFPIGIIANTASFVPDNFWQTGLSMGVGNQVQETYSHLIKPYINAGLIYNSTAGYGSEVSAGAKTEVIGHDQLSLDYTRSSINGGQSQTNFIVGLTYRYYFS